MTVTLVGIVTAVVAGVGPLSSPRAAEAAPDPVAAQAAELAADWLTGQLVDGGLPGFAGTDWGLTIDALFALQATGTQPAAVTQITEAVAANGDGYAVFRDGDLAYRDGGSTAKVLAAAAAGGEDGTDFGGDNWRQRTLDLVFGAEDGPMNGWLHDDYAGSLMGENMFGQSLAVLGLARSGGVPQPVVDFLVTQQCPGGGFRLYPGAGGTSCAEDPEDNRIPDVDTTGMVVQALIAAERAGATGTSEPVAAATDWLRSVQAENGSFNGSVVTDYPNTNSTGLGGQALAAAGDTDAAGNAAEFVVAQQLTAANGGAAAAHAGAIAYTPESFASAVASGIEEFALDQWRRATTQAILGLTQVPLGEIGADDGTGPTPTASPTGSATPSPTVSATSSGGPSQSPTGNPSQTPSSTPGPSGSVTATPTSAPATTTAPPNGAGGNLPTTGLSIVTFSVVGLGTVGGGIALMLLTRRRRDDAAAGRG
ncbi:cell wall anchor protein [Micromonospora sp. NBC_01699]|uniref:prenyltransferase/squalene oxidase repeat-containing protein n=1 Tax=Micromonospora sp. NBC_01699 TaxID=2975984 RepID=UPI002E295B6C|nr:prenyltransferase/squalene oxidase repeat-containing protein [Micromonospora sp. NBC_01699]